MDSRDLDVHTDGSDGAALAKENRPVGRQGLKTRYCSNVEAGFFMFP